MPVIDRSSPVPYYEQLYEHLVERVRGGELAAGERLPGESELRREFGLSRATARQSLELLESKGWARKIARRGFFVTHPDQTQGWLIEGLGGFLEQSMGHGNPDVSTTVKRAATAELPEHACRALKIPPGSIGFVLERVRSVDGESVLFSTNYTPPEVAPVIAAATDVLGGTSSLSEALRAAGLAPGGAHRVIHALGAPRHVAEHLQIAERSPLIRIRSTTWTHAGLRYDAYETWLRTEVVPLEINVTAHRNGTS